MFREFWLITEQDYRKGKETIHPLKVTGVPVSRRPCACHFVLALCMVV